MRGGVDYHKDQNYDKSFGGFIGQRLRDGYDMTNNEDILTKEEKKEAKEYKNREHRERRGKKFFLSVKP